MMEIWKDIKGYEGLYQVSNLGRVKSLNYNHTGKEKILKEGKCSGGYVCVHLCKKGKMRTVLIHRLVAQAFIPNPDNLPQVNHKDENKQSNIVENLEWCDQNYNNNYGTRIQRTSDVLINYPIFSKPVLQKDKHTNEVIAEFPSIREVTRQLGFGENAIRNCCNGRSSTSNGYKWQYKEVS